MLVAKVAGDDSAVYVRVCCLTAVVANDWSAVLVLESVSISIFLSYSSTAANEQNKRRKSVQALVVDPIEAKLT
jgi:isopropylmalate/homocitrate/citramalate synthase